MFITHVIIQDAHPAKNNPSPGHFLFVLSIILQMTLALFLGHAYDMRIFMATGYLVGTGQNPYIAQDLSSIFHNASFQGITSIGYPPPWTLLLGLIYLGTYRIIPNLLLYNLAIKIPIIAANMCLAYLVGRILNNLGVEEQVSRRARLFLLFNPFFLYVTSAWGQIDSIVALFALLALVLLSKERLTSSAIMLALAIIFKPIALPLIPAIFIYLQGRPFWKVSYYFSIFLISSLVLFVGPFVILRWDPTQILQHWNAIFTVGGGMSFMTFLELFQNSYQLDGWWWLIGMLWLPALCVAAFELKADGKGLLDLLKKSTTLILVFYLFRAWLSEPNLALVLPMILILTSLRELDSRILTAIWILALVYSFFNTSTIQLLFPSMQALMARLLLFSDVFRIARLIIRILVVVPWLIIEARLVISLLKENDLAKIPA